MVAMVLFPLFYFRAVVHMGIKLGCLRAIPGSGYLWSAGHWLIMLHPGDDFSTLRSSWVGVAKCTVGFTKGKVLVIGVTKNLVSARCVLSQSVGVATPASTMCSWRTMGPCSLMTPSKPRDVTSSASCIMPCHDVLVKMRCVPRPY